MLIHLTWRPVDAGRAPTKLRNQAIPFFGRGREGRGRQLEWNEWESGPIEELRAALSSPPTTLRHSKLENLRNSRETSSTEILCSYDVNAVGYRHATPSILILWKSKTVHWLLLSLCGVKCEEVVLRSTTLDGLRDNSRHVGTVRDNFHARNVLLNVPISISRRPSRDPQQYIVDPGFKFNRTSGWHNWNTSSGKERKKKMEEEGNKKKGAANKRGLLQIMEQNSEGTREREMND